MKILLHLSLVILVSCSSLKKAVKDVNPFNIKSVVIQKRYPGAYNANLKYIEHWKIEINGPIVKDQRMIFWIEDYAIPIKYRIKEGPIFASDNAIKLIEFDINYPLSNHYLKDIESKSNDGKDNYVSSLNIEFDNKMYTLVIDSIQELEKLYYPSMMNPEN